MGRNDAHVLLWGLKNVEMREHVLELTNEMLKNSPAFEFFSQGMVFCINVYHSVPSIALLMSEQFSSMMNEDESFTRF